MEVGPLELLLRRKSTYIIFRVLDYIRMYNLCFWSLQKIFPFVLEQILHFSTYLFRFDTMEYSGIILP